MFQRFLQYLFLFILACVFLEGVGYFLFYASDKWMGKNYGALRDYMRAPEAKNANRFFTPALTLGYFNTPGYIQAGQVQINSAGCRGPEIDQIKPRRTYRILFLGGSTTYCYGVDSIEQTYPYLTGELLKQKLYEDAGFKLRYDSLQVINAGLDGGTSYEMLYHYIAKMKYYQPDLVILHEGGNDALQFADSAFSPDYTHKRRPAQQLVRVSGLGRALLSSRFISFIFFSCFYSNAHDDSRIGDEPPGVVQPLYYKWLQQPKEQIKTDMRRYPFNTNTRLLVEEIKRDSAKAILFPFIYSKANIEKLAKNFQGSNNMAETYVAGIEYNATVYDSISHDLKTGYLPFNTNIVSPENFIDDCHLNASGNMQKAQYASAYIFSLITKEGW